MQDKVGKYAFIKGGGCLYIKSYDEKNDSYLGVNTDKNDKFEMVFHESEVEHYADEVCKNVIIE